MVWILGVKNRPIRSGKWQDKEDDRLLNDIWSGKLLSLIGLK
jgi:hypothetical protein